MKGLSLWGLLATVALVVWCVPAYSAARTLLTEAGSGRGALRVIDRSASPRSDSTGGGMAADGDGFESLDSRALGDLLIADSASAASYDRGRMAAVLSALASLDPPAWVTRRVELFRARAGLPSAKHPLVAISARFSILAESGDTERLDAEFTDFIHRARRGEPGSRSRLAAAAQAIGSVSSGAALDVALAVSIREASLEGEDSRVEPVIRSILGEAMATVRREATELHLEQALLNPESSPSDFERSLLFTYLERHGRSPGVRRRFVPILRRVLTTSLGRDMASADLIAASVSFGLLGQPAIEPLNNLLVASSSPALASAIQTGVTHAAVADPRPSRSLAPTILQLLSKIGAAPPKKKQERGKLDYRALCMSALLRVDPGVVLRNLTQLGGCSDSGLVRFVDGLEVLASAPAGFRNDLASGVLDLLIRRAQTNSSSGDLWQHLERVAGACLRWIDGLERARQLQQAEVGPLVRAGFAREAEHILRFELPVQKAERLAELAVRGGTDGRLAMGRAIAVADSIDREGAGLDFLADREVLLMLIQWPKLAGTGELWRNLLTRVSPELLGQAPRTLVVQFLQSLANRLADSRKCIERLDSKGAWVNADPWLGIFLAGLKSRV